MGGKPRASGSRGCCLSPWMLRFADVRRDPAARRRSDAAERGGAEAARKQDRYIYLPESRPTRVR